MLEEPRQPWSTSYNPAQLLRVASGPTQPGSLNSDPGKPWSLWYCQATDPSLQPCLIAEHILLLACSPVQAGCPDSDSAKSKARFTAQPDKGAQKTTLPDHRVQPLVFSNPSFAQPWSIASGLPDCKAQPVRTSNFRTQPMALPNYRAPEALPNREAMPTT